MPRKKTHGGRRPGAGRKPSDDSRTAIVKLRVTVDERRLWEQHASGDDKTLSEWIRRRCNQ